MTAHRQQRRASTLPVAVAAGALTLVIATGIVTVNSSPDRPPAAEPTQPVRVWTNRQLTAARADTPAPASDPIAAALGETHR